MPVTINGTTGISGVDGSAGTPAVIGSDADTGFLFTAGRVQASLNGTAANVGMVQSTAQNTTSGTSIDFTGIPSWARRVTVVFNGVSTNGTSVVQIQLGTSGGVETTGYAATLFSVTGANTCAVSGYTAGFAIIGSLAANTRSGMIILANVSGNTWVASGSVARTDDNISGSTQGVKTLGGVLDRVRITTANGTDAFDTGIVNVFYE